jgi:hypothetical protein
MAELFTIEVAGIEAALATIAKLQQRAQGVTVDLARDTGLIIQAEVDEVVNTAPAGATGGSVYGGKTWAALTDAYLQRRPDRATGQIYRDTGELLNSLSLGGKGNLLQADSDQLTFGSALPKAGRLQQLREYLFITDSMVNAIAARWELYVREGR